MLFFHPTKKKNALKKWKEKNVSVTFSLMMNAMVCMINLFQMPRLGTIVTGVGVSCTFTSPQVCAHLQVYLYGHLAIYSFTNTINP